MKYLVWDMLARAFYALQQLAAHGYDWTNRCPDCGRRRTGPACKNI